MLIFAPYNEAWTALWLTHCDWQQDSWRYVSAHFTHWNINHLIMNMAGLMIYIWLFMDDMKSKKAVYEQGLSLVFILLIIDSYLITCYKLDSYAGFSGILYGLFSFGSMRYWHSNKLICNLIILVLLVQLQPWIETTHFVAEQGIVIAKNVHLVAVLSAIPVALVCLYLDRRLKKS
jgi:rhomboid family GlyGly-CTERM serine protease